MSGDQDLVCYNRGCGKRFKEEENIDGSCQHHPGAPIFHEGYKGWGCCKKKTTDFTEFLNIPGCAKGFHNKEKLEVPPKNTEAPLEIGEVVKQEAKPVQQPPPKSKEERPSDDLPKTKLKTVVGSSLKAALKRYKDKLSEQNEKLDKESTNDAVLPGASCKHNACNMTYVDENSNKGKCIYHEGFPVFHEGYKYWTCCKKRTSDFDEFLKQVGCQNGSHDWMKPSDDAQKKSACRYDWHQTAPYVYISIYAKTCDPEQSYVEANRTSLHARIAFNGGPSLFELNLILGELIDPEESKVELLGTKVEIRLKKSSQFGWKDLEFKAKAVESS